ncbi:hypothetical protein LCGC14_2392280, partial [marine sediment metagenome]
YIIKCYGYKGLAELLSKHYIVPDMKNLAMRATEVYYKEKYQELVDLIK